jgi:hypothetical protein
MRTILTSVRLPIALKQVISELTQDAHRRGLPGIPQNQTEFMVQAAWHYVQYVQERVTAQMTGIELPEWGEK